MILLDTHVFVWWAAQRGKLSKKALRVLTTDQQPRLSDISLWEIAMLVSRGRLKFDRDVDVWLETALEETRIEIVAIDSAIAYRSTRIGAQFHGDPADQLIAATAIERRIALVTADENLRHSSAVTTIW